MLKILHTPAADVACLLFVLVVGLAVQSLPFSGSAETVVTASAAQASIAITWSMRERFGGKKANGFVDYHWDGEKQKYDDAYVHPTTWTVDFDACNMVPAQSALRWEIDGQPLTETTCGFAHDFPALRTYIVRLTVTGPGGQTQMAQESITPRDLLIVSIGDSFAAGQGTPERRFEAGHPLRPRWIDKPCHRSSWAGPARAAIIIEKSDPHSSVTFVSFACTGAGILDGLLEKQDKGGRKNFRQLDQLFDTAGERTVDALLVSIGGNDVHFAELVSKAILLPHAESNSGARTLLEEGMKALPERFALMAKRLSDLNNKARIASVFITEYPDLVRDETKDFCDHSVPVFDALHGISGAESEWALNTVIIPLNAKIREQATLRGWNYVGGILDKFGGNSPEGVAHGFCADDKRWVN